MIVPVRYIPTHQIPRSDSFVFDGPVYVARQPHLSLTSRLTSRRPFHLQTNTNIALLPSYPPVYIDWSYASPSLSQPASLKTALQMTTPVTTMSEKRALVPEPLVEQTDQDQDRDGTTPTSDSPKKASHARFWKFVCYFFADAELRGLHRFALTHAQEVYRARWEELTAWVSPWVMLLFVRITTHPFVYSSIHRELLIRMTRTDRQRD
jgi:hypothetical protein